MSVSIHSETTAGVPDTSKRKHRFLNGPQPDMVLVDEVFNSTGTPTDILWLLHDHQNTVTDVATMSSTSGQGTLRNHLEYNAFGEITSQTNATYAPLQTYTGQILDTTTGLLFYDARWYDPKLGRFVSEDPIGFAAGDANLTRYVGNSWPNGTDPTGLDQRGKREEYYRRLEDEIRQLEEAGQFDAANQKRAILADVREFDRSQTEDYIYGTDAMLRQHADARRQMTQAIESVDHYTLGAASFVLQAADDVDRGICIAANEGSHYSTFSEYERARIRDEMIETLTDPLTVLMASQRALSGQNDDPFYERIRRRQREIDLEEAQREYEEYQDSGFDPERDPGTAGPRLATGALIISGGAAVSSTLRPPGRLIVLEPDVSRVDSSIIYRKRRSNPLSIGCPDADIREKWSRSPRGLMDQMVLDAAQQGKGIRIIDSLNDSQFRGMEKWSYGESSASGARSEVHYVRDPVTGQRRDFKFKHHAETYR